MTGAEMHLILMQREIIGRIEGKICSACLSIKETVTLNQTSVWFCFFQTRYLAWETMTFVSAFCVSKFVCMRRGYMYEHVEVRG